MNAHPMRSITASLVCALLLAPSGLVLAGDEPDGFLGAEVLVLLASDKEGPVDPSVTHLRALKHPPFAHFKSMKLLQRSPVKLSDDQDAEFYLPNGRWIQLSLIERLPDGRAKVQVSINRPYEKDYLPVLDVIASPGEPFFVAGQKFQGGTLVIGVRVGERAKPRATQIQRR
jgi:hypothetical protein